MKNSPILRPSSSPTFDTDGYQTNLVDLGGTSLPPAETLTRLTPDQQRTLGLPTPTEAANLPIVIQRGGVRDGAGRKPLGKQRKMVKLSPAAIRRIEAYAKRKKLPHFSAAIEALAMQQ
jgi:hypothetical protein